MAKSKKQTQTKKHPKPAPFVLGASDLSVITKKLVSNRCESIIETHLKKRYWNEHVMGSVRGRWEFSGTIKEWFWSPKFIPKILDDAIYEILQQTAETCPKDNLKWYVKEAGIILKSGLVNRIYDYMVHLDQQLRTKGGNLKSVKCVEVYDDKVPKMHKLIEDYVVGFIKKASPKETTTAGAEQMNGKESKDFLFETAQKVSTWIIDKVVMKRFQEQAKAFYDDYQEWYMENDQYLKEIGLRDKETKEACKKRISKIPSPRPCPLDLLTIADHHTDPHILRMVEYCVPQKRHEQKFSSEELMKADYVFLTVLHDKALKDTRHFNLINTDIWPQDEEWAENLWQRMTDERSGWKPDFLLNELNDVLNNVETDLDKLPAETENKELNELIVLKTIGNKEGIKHSELLDNPKIVSWAFLKSVLISLAPKGLIEVHRGQGFINYQALQIVLNDDPGFKLSGFLAGGWRYRLTQAGNTLISRNGGKVGDNIKITKLTDFIMNNCEDSTSISSKANRIHEFVKKGKIKFMPKPVNKPKDNETKLYDEEKLREIWPQLKLKIKSLPNLKA